MIHKKRFVVFLLVLAPVIVILILLNNGEPSKQKVINNEKNFKKTEIQKKANNTASTSDLPEQLKVDKEEEEEKPIEDPEKIQNEDLSLFISDYHNVIDEITNYDKYKNIDWDNMATIEKNISKEIKQILSNKGSYPPSMKLDLERILKLSEISLQNNDSNSVVYIHRILHDLDVEYNDDVQPNNKFGFSNYDSGGENQSTVSNYIEDNYKNEDTQ